MSNNVLILKDFAAHPEDLRAVGRGAYPKNPEGDPNFSGAAQEDYYTITVWVQGYKVPMNLVYVDENERDDDFYSVINAMQGKLTEEKGG